MKRTPIKRKTPLRAKSPLQSHKPIKRTPMKAYRKPKPSAAVQKHWDNVASLGCLICRRTPQIHHPTGAGWALKASDFDVIPFCFEHHMEESPLPYGHAVHKGTKTFESLYGTQEAFLEQTRMELRMKGLPDGTVHPE